MEKLPIFFEIEEIEKHLGTLTKIKDKTEYLVNLREEFIKVCYHLNDEDIFDYLRDNSITFQYETLSYIEESDFEQTHISKSYHIKFLEHIDNNLLPYVRKILLSMDKSIKEDTSKIIKNYKYFGFDADKVLEYSDSLIEDKMAYLEWIKKEYADYIYDRVYYHHGKRSDFEMQISSLDFSKKISDRIITLKRNPNFNLSKIKENTISNNSAGEIFKKDANLHEFDFSKVKNHAKNLKETKEQILYLQHVKKEAKQNKETLQRQNNNAFIDSIESEIEYYDKKFKLEDTKSNSDDKRDLIDKDVIVNNIIKLKWQKDNVLLPYLFDVLFDEGFISSSDYENIHKFIEQSFVKKDGKPFTAKESVQSRDNYLINKTKKPRNSFKIERAIENLKNKKTKG